MMHAAIYDAVNSIDRSHRAYMISVPAPRGASETAAADAAAHTVLAFLYPSQQSVVDATYATELATVPDGAAKVAGVRVGAEVARGLLTIRADDGATGRTASVRPWNESRRLPPDPAEPGGTGLHDLGAGHALRARERQPVPARTAAGADEP